jgi:methionyl-tRNA formyltransferase
VLRSADGTEQDFKIYSATPVSAGITGKPGTIRCDGKRFIEVCTADGAIRLDEVQVAGKKRMPVSSFLCGNDLSDGCFFA